eukprot:gene13159-8659_t
MRLLTGRGAVAVGVLYCAKVAGVVLASGTAVRADAEGPMALKLQGTPAAAPPVPASPPRCPAQPAQCLTLRKAASACGVAAGVLLFSSAARSGRLCRRLCPRRSHA